MYGKKRVYASKAKEGYKKVKTLSKPPYYKPRFSIMATNSNYSIAKTLRVTHRYQDNFTVTGVTGATGVYVFSLNSLYDPNVTGAGHQPSGFDEMGQIYNEYVVVGFTARIIAKNTNATAVAIAGAFVTKGPSAYSALARYVENGYGTYKPIGASNLTNDITNLYLKGDMNELFGNNVLNDSNAAGTSSTSPSEQRYLHVTISSFDVASTITSAQFNVEIAYDVVWRDRAGLSLS